MKRTIEYILIKDLNLLHGNPRKITQEQLNKLCESIESDKEFFDLRPCLVNRVDGILTVYAGNQRVRAAKKLKWKEVPCIIDDNLDEDVMKKRIIKDNKTFGEFDYDILANEWEIETLLYCGFTADDLQGCVQDIDTDEKDNNTKDEKIKCELCGK